MPRMTGKRAMLEQLIADGVHHVFGNPGTTEQGFGPGLPGSLSAQLARPDRKVVGVCSDGAAMYSISACGRPRTTGSPSPT